MRYFREWASPLGAITLAGDGERLTGLWFRDQRFFGAGLLPDARPGGPELFREAERWLEVYFGGGVPDFTPPLGLTGTPFRQGVYRLLLTVPFGATVTYGELAARLPREEGAGPASPRAVGGAVARNPISLIIPCHRVVGAGGRLTGYAGGLDRKARLLAIERRTQGL